MQIQKLCAAEIARGVSNDPQNNDPELYAEAERLVRNHPQIFNNEARFIQFMNELFAKVERLSHNDPRIFNNLERFIQFSGMLNRIQEISNRRLLNQLHATGQPQFSSKEISEKERNAIKRIHVDRKRPLSSIRKAKMNGYAPRYMNYAPSYTNSERIWRAQWLRNCILQAPSLS